MLFIEVVVVLVVIGVVYFAGAFCYADGVVLLQTILFCLQMILLAMLAPCASALRTMLDK